jgi:hypothetical protein
VCGEDICTAFIVLAVTTVEDDDGIIFADTLNQVIEGSENALPCSIALTYDGDLICGIATVLLSLQYISDALCICCGKRNVHLWGVLIGADSDK